MVGGGNFLLFFVSIKIVSSVWSMNGKVRIGEVPDKERIEADNWVFWAGGPVIKEGSLFLGALWGQG